MTEMTWRALIQGWRVTRNSMRNRRSREDDEEEEASGLQPACQFPFSQLLQHCKPPRAVVQTGKIGKTLAPFLQNARLQANSQLFESFQTVCGKAGTDHGDLPYALPGQGPYRLVRIGLQPFLATETRLEDHLEPFLGQFQIGAQQT